MLAKPEIAEKLRMAADSVGRIGEIVEAERAQAACEEASAILAEAARDYAPAPPKPPDTARQHAAAVAAQAKP
jgi:hypothetical protein